MRRTIASICSFSALCWLWINKIWPLTTVCDYRLHASADVRQLQDIFRRKFNLCDLAASVVDPIYRSYYDCRCMGEAEWPGILAWAIAGCLDWQKHGLIIPEKVRAATDAYFQDQDVFKQWLDDETVAGEGLSDTNTRLMQSWTSYAKEHGEITGNSKQFAERMRRYGASGPHVTSKDGKSLRVFRGLRALMQ